MDQKIGLVSPELFDEKFYRHAYTDVSHSTKNMYEHYSTIGIIENRLPNRDTFKRLYPYFRSKICKIMSPELKFTHNEQYYSHFHHCGFAQNKFYGFKNNTFINRSSTHKKNHVAKKTCAYQAQTCSQICPHGQKDRAPTC